MWVGGAPQPFVSYTPLVAERDEERDQVSLSHGVVMPLCSMRLGGGKAKKNLGG